MRGKLVSRPVACRPPRGREAGRRRRPRAAGHQPGHLGLRPRPPPRRPRLERPRGPQPPHRPRPRTRHPRRLGAPPLRLPLPARPRPDPADGRGAASCPTSTSPSSTPTPTVLKRMARPAASAKTLDEIARWRADCPDITLRSTFIVGYPGETEAEFEHLLDWLDEAQLDRVGASSTRTSPAPAPTPSPTTSPRTVKEERWQRFMARAQAISAAKLRRQGRHPPRGHRRRRRRRGRDLPHARRRPGDRRPPLHRRGLRRPRPRRHPHGRGRGVRRLRLVGPPGLSPEACRRHRAVTSGR